MARKYNPEKTTKALQAASKMPALKHSTTDPFDAKESEVVKWLIDQPEVLNAIFNYYKDRGAIVFDKEAGTWKGVES